MYEAIQLISWSSNVLEYTCIDPACDSSSENPRYRIYIELDEIPNIDNLDEYAKQFDDGLSKINPIYLSFREKQSIGFPSLNIVKSGTFANIRQDMINNGTGINQVKIPRVTRYENHIEILQNSTI